MTTEATADEFAELRAQVLKLTEERDAAVERYEGFRDGYTNERETLANAALKRAEKAEAEVERLSDVIISDTGTYDVLRQRAEKAEAERDEARSLLADSESIRDRERDALNAARAEGRRILEVKETAMAEKPRVEFVEFLKRLKECPDFIINGIDTVGPPPDGQSADVHLFVNGERLKLYMQGPPQMYEMLDFTEAAREWVPQLLAERERLRGLIARAEVMGCKCGPASENTGCPWCKAQLVFDGRDMFATDTRAGGFLPLEHDADCPAFSAPGVVR